MSLHSDLINEILTKPVTPKDHAAKAEIESLRGEIEQLKAKAEKKNANKRAGVERSTEP